MSIDPEVHTLVWPNGADFDPATLHVWPAHSAALITGSGVDFMNDKGIWATDQNGTPRIIARTGDILQVAPSDFRTISSLGFIGDTLTSTIFSPTGNEDGRASGFNDLGQLAFFANFTDGSSGIFVSNLVAIPEPSALVLIALGLIGILLRETGIRHIPVVRIASERRGMID